MERFLNEAARADVALWQVERRANGLQAATDPRGFRALRRCARESRCHIRLLDKRGLPFYWFWLTRRPALIVGLVLFLGLIYGMSAVVWQVDIELDSQGQTLRPAEGAAQGVEGAVDEESTEAGLVDPRPEIRRWLEQKGLMVGVCRLGLPLDRLEAELCADMPELSWASFALRGSRLTLKVALELQPPPMWDADAAIDLVAARDGVVERLLVLSGTAVVEAGDTVTKGQVLIRGLAPSTQEGVSVPTHARGQVWLRCWLRGLGEASLYEERLTPTGRLWRTRWLEWPGTALRLPQALEAPPALEASCRWETSYTASALCGEGFGLPLQRVTALFREYSVEQVARGREAARAEAQAQAEEALEKQLQALNAPTPEETRILQRWTRERDLEDGRVQVASYAELLLESAAESPYTRRTDD